MTQEKALLLFKSLSDLSRLRIVEALSQGEMYTELLAERLNLTPSTVSFHMKKLEEAGAVVSRKEQYYTVYSLNREVLDRSLYETAVSAPVQADEQKVREEKYRQKVIDAFFEYGKLKAIPVQRKKRTICYEKIAESLVPGKVYEEKELDEILTAFHEDYCTVRRDMIGEGILTREGSWYTRVR